ncbi:peptidyl-prolyl cis-trans isomerase [Paraglaciecola marina]|uniref:peptidylprolyl isomerase n=1 Tax=Paraglaciecola marina TaxID=2500157 RepID=UPI0010617E28|nr:peptidylprolyl isomerase [Paraglaciecola marina]
MLKKLYQDPLVLFVIFGVIVFSLYSYLQQASEVPIELSENNRTLFVKQLELLTGRAATPEDIAKIEKTYIQEEVLFREALAAGLHLSNSEIRETLVEEMRLQATGELSEPSEKDLVPYYLKHIKRYVIEPSLSFQHVFFEQQPEADILDKLSAGETVTGDEFWRGRTLPNYGISMIRGMFGQSFLETLESAATDEWYGPEQSLFGWHFVKVTASRPSMPLTYEQAQMQVRNDYTVDILETSVEDFIKNLDDKYKIIRHVN